MTEALAPRQLADEAKTLYAQREFKKAAQVYLAASRSFASASDALSDAEMRNNACVAWLQARQGQPALSAVEGTPAIFAAAGEVRRQGMALGNLAAALEALHRLPEATEVYGQSADVLGQCGDQEQRAYVLKSLSALHLRTGRQWEALATMQAGLEGLPRPSFSERLLKRLLTVLMNLLKRG